MDNQTESPFLADKIRKDYENQITATNALIETLKHRVYLMQEELLELDRLENFLTKY